MAVSVGGGAVVVSVEILYLFSSGIVISKVNFDFHKSNIRIFLLNFWLYHQEQNERVPE